MLSPETLRPLVAWLWIGLLAALAIVYLISLLRRSPYSLWENVLYLPTYLWGRVVWRVDFANRPPAEMLGGAILVANHRSSVDPFFVQLSAGRRVHWMVAREYCENPVLGPVLRSLQVIPTNRSGMDTGATKQAIRLAKEGRLVGMFPEGRLNHTLRDPLVSIRPGAALIALRAGVPMIPLYILGSPYRREVWSPLSMPAHVRITFGEPIDPRRFAEQNAALNIDGACSTIPGDAAINEPKHNSNTDHLPTDHPSISESSTNQPATSQPATSQPATSQPATSQPATGQPATESSGRLITEDETRRRQELEMIEHMMLHWGKQIATMAGRPEWKIEIAGRSRLARTTNVN